MALEVTRRPNTWPTEVGRDLVPLRTMMDRLFENAFTTSFANGWGTGGVPFGWDVYEDEDAFYIHAYLPGIDPNAVNLSVQDNVLSVSGETKRATPEGWRPLIQELGFGTFERRLTLNMPVEAAQAEADYQDGILKIELPKAEMAKPRQIKITAHAGAR
jgi:HSP20 family protein